MEIFYGFENNYINVTSICISKLYHNNIIDIPAGDVTRNIVFGDPCSGIRKKVRIYYDNTFVTYDELYNVKINLLHNTITYDNLLTDHTSKLHIKHGSFNDEIPEQKMVLLYLTGSEKVLEIGGNVGRNSLLIASILKDSTNLVTIECNPITANLCKENRDYNNYHYHVETSALSKRKLIQNVDHGGFGHKTVPCDVLHEGYSWVNTITFEELKHKYDIEFDTLVLDCEGAFYYILMDFPEILKNIRCIIMENDYEYYGQKEYIDKTLIENNFVIDYREICPSPGPCSHCFYEVWKK